MPGVYELKVNTTGLRKLIEKAHVTPGTPGAQRIGLAVRQAGAIVQARAVRNVTGYPIVYQGGVFRVMVRTGALRGSIELQWPWGGTVFSARIYVNGTVTSPQVVPGISVKAKPVSDYAGAIEWGHPEIDLKKTMQGKVVPFFGARAKAARGPFAGTGLQPLTPGRENFGDRFVSPELNVKLALKGKRTLEFVKKGSKQGYVKKGGGAYFIAFRRVGKTGWIIPEAAPRPFMRAALEGTKDQVRRVIVNAAVGYLQEQIT